MILFDVKNDGTVKTVPMEMAQGSTLADLVVIAEAEYALVTMRLVPPSGLYIPDIIFARIKVDGAIMWKADLPADASITEGSIKYQIFLTDATGEVLETPEGRMTIPKSVLSDMPETVEHLKQYTINELYTLLSGIHTEMTAVDTRLDNIDTRLRLSRLTIPVTEWTDGMPYQATAWLPDMEFGQSEYTKAYTALLIPLNKETRLEAQKTELRVNETIAFPSGAIEIILLREDHVPSVPLDFAVATLMLDNPDTTVFKASASFVGVTELPDELMDKEVLRVLKANKYANEERVTELISQEVPAWAMEPDPPEISEETDPTVPSWAKQPNKPSYSKSEVGLGNVDNVRQYSKNNPPPYPVTSVAGKTGAVTLKASDVGADASGTASKAVSEHNVSSTAHNDLRVALKDLADRLSAALNSDDTTLDDLKEVVAYIKSNRSLIDEIAARKVNVADIVDNLETSVTDKPLSAAQGVALKGLIDGMETTVRKIIEETILGGEW